MYQFYLGFWRYLQIFVIATTTVKHLKCVKTIDNVTFLKTLRILLKGYKP